MHTAYSFNSDILGEPGLANRPHYVPSSLFWTCASSWESPKLFISSLTPSHQVLLEQPFCLARSTYIIILPSQNEEEKNGLNLLIYLFPSFQMLSVCDSIGGSAIWRMLYEVKAGVV